VTAKLVFSQALLDVECAQTWVYMHIHKSMTKILSCLSLLMRRKIKKKQRTGEC